MTMADAALKFDHPEVNVDLAKKYLKENEDAIKNMNFKNKFIDDGWVFHPRKREILAKRLKENSKLICQLEYMINNTPIEDTEKNIQLMLQYLSLTKKYKATRGSTDKLEKPVTVLKNSPLATIIHGTERGALAVCEERSAVCHVILNLCAEDGLLSSNFKVTYKASGDKKDFHIIPSCTGIVSEKSDLDSAVDAFLSSSSSSTCFWRLRKIFVQESIFQSFKELIEFKVKIKESKTSKYEELRNLSSDLFVYENKVLLFDFVGDADALRVDAAHFVFIEAYRTNKELISLIGEISRIDSVSLWCADVAEANEIAYSVPASLVWINDYGNYDGPPEISTFLINFFVTNEDGNETYFDGKPLEIPKKIIDLYEVWKRYDNKKRANIISNILEDVKEASSLSDEGRDTKYNMLKLLEQISNLKFSAVDVAGGKICVTLDSPVGFNFDESFGFDADVLGSLVIGNGVICDCLSGPTVESLSLHLKLQRAGVPIWSMNESMEDDETNKIKFHNFRFLTKVVLTNFGTIFAN